MRTEPFEKAIAAQFRLTQAPTLLAPQTAASPISFTRLRNDGEFRGQTTPVPTMEAFSFQVALAPMSPGRVWIGGKQRELSPSPGSAFLFDLASSTVADLPPPYDYLRFAIPTVTLDQMAYDRGIRRVGGLRTSDFGGRDGVLHGLALALVPAIMGTFKASALFLDSVAFAFHAHIISHYGGSSENLGSSRSGLTPWQLRRAHAFIEAHLDGDPSVSDLAKECGVSSSHFARAFRNACGTPPHRWLMMQRVERAKELLLAGDLELAEIALTCGFADQSHMSRIFLRHEGHSPGRWRRLRRN